MFVADHGKNLRHGVVYTFYAAVPAWMVGACRELVYTYKLIDGCRKLCAKLESVV